MLRPYQKPIRASSSTAPRLKISNKKSGFRFTLLVASLVIFGALFIDEGNSNVKRSLTVSTTNNNIPQSACPKFCRARHDQLVRHHKGDLVKDMLHLARDKHNELLDKLKKDYGDETFRNMFRPERFHQILQSANETLQYSTNHLKRKIQMKLLQVQMEILTERESLEGCNCTTSALREQTTNPSLLTSDIAKKGRRQQQRRRLKKRTVVLPPVPKYYQRFVWATGGHSSAAAHGNLYNESYTAVLQRAVGPIFDALGLQFEGRNYAMGGMDSAPQIALCQESIFGTDSDIITWDFGMTDGRALWKTNLYANRVGVHKNRPVHVSINLDEHQFPSSRKALLDAEELGVPAMYLNPMVQKEILDGVPDSFGMKQEEIDKMGPFASYLKCKNHIEKEEPCISEKYNDKVCPKRSFKANWHPGYRVHALTGNILALGLSQILLEMLQEWDAHKIDPFQLYAQLKAEEDASYAKISSSEIPQNGTIPGLITEEMAALGLHAKHLLRKEAICHTALLPAESRYLGILTQSSKQGFHDYDLGTPLKARTSLSTENRSAIHETEGSSNSSSTNFDPNPMTLTYEPDKRQDCPVQLNADYKDYYLITDRDGWSSITVPNDAELRAYGSSSSSSFDPAGLVMVCLMKCDWGRCEPGEFQLREFDLGLLKFEVNGQPVVNMTGFKEWNQCSLLRGPEGIDLYHKPNLEGRFEVRAFVTKGENQTLSFTRILSVIVL